MAVKISGIEDVNNILAEIAPREAVNLLRSTVHDMAGQIAKDARARMPRDNGDMIRGTKHHRRRAEAGRVQSDVAVAGAFYWRFLEYGQGPDGVEHAMFLAALQAMRPQMERVYLETFAKKLIARMTRMRKAKG